MVPNGDWNRRRIVAQGPGPVRRYDLVVGKWANRTCALDRPEKKLPGSLETLVAR